MCTGAEAGVIAALVSAAGTGASLYTQQDAAARQDRIAAQGIAQQAELSRAGQRRVSQEAQTVQESNPEAAKQNARTDFMAALQRAKLTQGGAGLESAPGAVSGRYGADIGAARAAAGAENATTADLLARIVAPTEQRLREGQGAAAAASDLSLLGGRSSGMDFLTRLRTAGQTANPWISGIGQGLASGAQAWAGRMQPVPKGVVPIGTPTPVMGGFGGGAFGGS
jgi:hypothetical protein